MHRLRGKADEIKEALHILTVGDRIGLEGMDHVGELDRIADEEDIEVIADEIPIAILGIELDGEAARIAQRLRGMATVDTLEKRMKSGVRLPFS